MWKGECVQNKESVITPSRAHVIPRSALSRGDIDKPERNLREAAREGCPMKV